MSILMIGIASCQKDCPTVDPPPDPLRLAGNWVGKYSQNDASNPTLNQYWTLKENGELLVYDVQTSANSLTSKGSWNHIGNTFICTYTNLSGTYNRSIKLTLNEDENEMSGFRGENGAYTGEGQCEMSRD